MEIHVTTRVQQILGDFLLEPGPSASLVTGSLLSLREMKTLKQSGDFVSPRHGKKRQFLEPPTFLLAGDTRSAPASLKQ